MNILKNLLILLIKFYKYFISPYFPSNCRYLPTCSDYFIDSIKLNGAAKSIITIENNENTKEPNTPDNVFFGLILDNFVQLKILPKI